MDNNMNTDKNRTCVECSSCESSKSKLNMHSRFQQKCSIGGSLLTYFPGVMAMNAIAVLFCSTFLFGMSHGCNIDTTVPIRYREGDGDYFGYTVLEHDDGIGKYVVIGAPKGSSPRLPSLERPGIIYKCATADPYKCSEIQLDSVGNEVLPDRVDDKNDAWLGVSLSRQNIVDGLLTTCGHRYVNKLYLNETDFERKDAYPIGMCYSFKLYNSQATNRFTKFEVTYPCLGNGIADQWHGDTRWLSWCQAGMASALTDGPEETPTVLYGAPGAYNWSGTVIPEINDAIDTMNIPNWDAPMDGAQRDVDYTGYAVATGHFVGQPGVEQGVAGAPRGSDLLGKVTIYDIANNTVYQELYGEPMNTYFGSALAAVDVNGDGLDDLLVGAPLFSNDQDEGKVYVYLSTGPPNAPLQLAQEIQGSRAFRARFGTSISSAGDLNQDGYDDAVIGAPYEEDGVGAVYIYFGGASGMDPAFSQRITGNDIAEDENENVTTFGISVHGSLDMDGNTYPDILIGAYESDSAYLLRGKPLIQLQAWLELEPSSVDPDRKTCELNGVAHVCIQVKACFHFTGLTVTSLLDIVYSIDVDEENVAAGIDPRFQLDDGGTLKHHIEGMHGIREDITSCTSPFTAYLSNRARDFLAPVPMKLTYDVFKYDIQTAIRGDEPYLFPSGIPPLSDSYNCAAETFTTEVIFVQNCGLDAICQTDIVLSADVELPGGKDDAMILGADPTLYINAKIDNAGEEAHQAILQVFHPSDMGYEGVELVAVSCLPLADKLDADCTPEVVTICTPQIGQDTSAIVECNLGNPMNAYNSATLRLRFDVSDIPWSRDRLINITMVASTVSIEENMENDRLSLGFSVVVEADLAIGGTSAPESVYYGYNATSMGFPDQAAADKEKLRLTLEAVNNFYEYDYDPSRYNETHIGPAFNHEFRVVNYGQGRLPLTSDVTIQVPWRTLDGDMLLFIKTIKVGEDQGSCNLAKILDLQRRRVEALYESGSVTYSEEEEGSQTATSSEDGDNELGCSKAKCVEVACSLFLLEKDELVKITIEAVLWEYTFVTRNYGLIEVVTEALVQSNDPDGIHSQPEVHQADSTRVKTTAYTGTLGSGKTPWWVILLAILIGLLFLIAVILILWKLGFFKRGMKEEMKSEYDEVPQGDPAAT